MNPERRLRRRVGRRPDPADAKARLRQLAGQADPGEWVRGHPVQAVALAFAAGLLVGSPRARDRVEGLIGRLTELF